MTKAIAIACIIWLLPGLSWAQPSERAVKIKSWDGFELSGQFVNSRVKGPGILLLHQCNRKGNETGFENLVSMFAEAGFHALMLDSRGFGKSRNAQFPDYRSNMEQIDRKVADDVEAAYQFLISQRGVDPTRVGLVGASCGTWQGIALAANHVQIRTLVFLSGSYLDLDNIVNDYATITDRPILAIYAEEDRYRTPESMRAAFSQSRHPASRLIVYKGDAHGTPLFDQNPDLEVQIVDWFEAHLSRN